MIEAVVSNLDRLGKARIRWERDRAHVAFADDLMHYELKEYEDHLPQSVKHRRKGKTLVIETPDAFRAWLDGGRKRSWWRRLRGR